MSTSGAMNVQPSRDLEALEGIKESWDICVNIGLSQKLWEKRGKCKETFQWLITRLVHPTSSTIFYADTFVISVSSLLKKLYIKELLESHLPDIEPEFTVLIQQRNEECYKDLTHAMIIIMMHIDYIRIGRGTPPTITCTLSS